MHTNLRTMDVFVLSPARSEKAARTTPGHSSSRTITDTIIGEWVSNLIDWEAVRRRPCVMIVHVQLLARFWGVDGCLCDVVSHGLLSDLVVPFRDWR